MAKEKDIVMGQVLFACLFSIKGMYTVGRMLLGALVVWMISSLLFFRGESRECPRFCNPEGLTICYVCIKEVILFDCGICCNVSQSGFHTSLAGCAEEEVSCCIIIWEAFYFIHTLTHTLTPS